jgi:hypothetical protein
MARWPPRYNGLYIIERYTAEATGPLRKEFVSFIQSPIHEFIFVPQFILNKRQSFEGSTFTAGPTSDMSKG